MFTPDEEKRRKMLELSRKGEEQYKARREARQSHQIREVPRSLGGHSSQAAVVAKKQREIVVAAKQSPLKLKEKREKYVQQKKEAENKRNEELQSKARVQANRNELRQSQRSALMHDDRRRKNSEFLDRLESSSRLPAADESRQHASTSRVYSDLDRGSVTSQDPALHHLCTLFPEYEPSVLAEVLEAADGSVEQAKFLLV